MQGKLSPVILVTDQSTTDQSSFGKNDSPVSSYALISLFIIIPILLALKIKKAADKRENAVLAQSYKPSKDAPDDIKLEACILNMDLQGRIRSNKEVIDLTCADIEKYELLMKYNWKSINIEKIIRCKSRLHFWIHYVFGCDIDKWMGYDNFTGKAYDEIGSDLLR